MPRIRANGIEIDYAEAGRADDPAVILIRGLGTQRIQWPQRFLELLCERGLRVVTPDNRDVGGSQKFDEAGRPDVAAAMAVIRSGGEPQIAYRLGDMAQDVVAGYEPIMET